MPKPHPKQLQWLCRRGTKELDHILNDYLKNHYPHASQQEQQRFAQWLQEEDPVIWNDLQTAGEGTPAERVGKVLGGKG